MQTFWDPVGTTVTDSTFSEQIGELKNKLATYQANPEKLMHTLLLLGGSGVVLFGALLYFGYDIRFLIFPFMPVVFYVFYIKTIQTDLALYLFAQNRKWAFNPSMSPDHWQLFAREFPIIFGKGNYGSQFLENEFWGKMEVEGSNFDFWKGVFQYTTGSGKHKVSHRFDAMAFHLPRPVKADLVLSPEGFHILGEGHDDIKTESVEFNKKFEISCPGMDASKQQEIVKALSPAVQTKLLDLTRVRGSYYLALKNNALVMCFSNYKNPVSNTNFFKKVEIDQRDIEAIQEDFRTILSAVGDLLRYMD
jgi:hypothetical protein